MPAIKTILLSGLSSTVLCGPLQGGPLIETHPYAATNNCILSADVRHEEGPGMLPADRTYVRAGTNTFAFLVPNGFKFEGSGDGGVTLVSRDYSCRIVFRIDGTRLNGDSEPAEESCLQNLRVEHPQARVIKTFPAVADSRNGRAYEIEFVGVGGTLRHGQAAYIPSRAGLLEFSLECNAEDFEARQRQLNTVMLTFRASDARGELHVSPLSDRL